MVMVFWVFGLVSWSGCELVRKPWLLSVDVVSDRSSRTEPPIVSSCAYQFGVAADRLMAGLVVVGSAGRVRSSRCEVGGHAVASASPASWPPPGQVTAMSTSSLCGECGAVALVITRHGTYCARCAIAFLPTQVTVPALEKRRGREHSRRLSGGPKPGWEVEPTSGPS